MDNKRNKLSILSIDDDPIILNSIFSALSELYTVYPFTSGKQALDFLDKKIPDLILLDIYMPEMNGIELLQIIRENERLKDIPLIFLTGDSDRGGETGALNTGANDYITKPVHPEMLQARIKIQIELYRHRKNLENLVLEKTKAISEREDVILDMLARTTDLRDPDTGGHILRTTEYTRLICDELVNNYIEYPESYRLTAVHAADIAKTAKLHDFGKISVPDNVLLKPARLTPEEFDIIKRHTTKGWEMLEEFSKNAAEDTFWDDAKDIAHYHHEKWNGKGYPDGLKGEQIPISARIVALADVYDALTSKRVYKDAMSFETAEGIIMGDKGEHFDPIITDIFFKFSDKFRNISESIK